MTDLRKNQYEEIIDQMMIDEVAGIDDDLRETLNGLDVKKKRRAILSILDKDRGLFSRINKLLTQGVGVNKTEYITEVVTMLRDYVKVGHVEKKKFGEVMTPIWLVEEMLNKLPAEVWSNPSLKWLDSCNGVGIFPSVVVKRLMAGLVGFEPDEELRYKHIVEKMIYVGELQPKNMFLFLCSFDPKDEYDLNVYTGSFLDAGFDNHMKNVWGIEKFDIIVGNPPYQNDSGNKGAGNTLWDKFVKKYIDLLIFRGYLLTVHPSGWRNINGVYKPLQQQMLSRQIEFLSIHHEKDGIKTFGAETRYDWYCMKNVPNTQPTSIRSQDGIVESVDLLNLKFIPSGLISVVLGLMAKDGDDKVELIHSESAYEPRKKWMSQKETDNHTFPCIYTVKKGDIATFKYSEINTKGHFGVPKLIFSNFRITSAGSLIDHTGAYGLTQFSTGLVEAAANLQALKIAFDSKLFRNIMQMCAVGQLSINRKIIAEFRKDFWKEFINEPVIEPTDAA